MTSGIGTLLHAYFHLRNQQAFQRLLNTNANAYAGDSSGMSVGTSPRSFKAKSGFSSRDEEVKVDVNARDGFGRTVLHLASACVDASSVEYVRMLLKAPGINVNSQDWESQWTALHRAMYAGNLVVVLLLLQHSNTDPTLKDLEGYTAFDLYNSTVEGTKPEPSISPTGSTVSPIYAFAENVELFTWGVNRNASLGHGDTSDRSFPDHVPVPHPHVSRAQNSSVEERFARVGVRQVKMGRLHTAVISDVRTSAPSSTSSTLSLCGFGSGGRLGLTQHTQYALRQLSWTGSVQSQPAPSRSGPQSSPAPSTRVKVASVALGQDHTLAVTENGEVYSWGLNRFAQLGYTVDDGSTATAHVLDESGEFILFSNGTSGSGSTTSNGEQIQLVPRRVYGPLKREFVLGVAACKGASACWVRVQDGSGIDAGGGNVFTWGLNGGQLGYERVGTGLQTQVLPRKVTKITRPVVQIALGESVMACLLGGPGGAGGGWKGDVLVVWGDRVSRLSFPAHTFPSPITPYRPPQALKSARIVKIVCSDESPPPFSMSSLSTSQLTAPGLSSSHPHSSNLSAMVASESASSGSTNIQNNYIHFACVSERGELFVFGVPGVPPVGAFGSSSSSSADMGDVDASSGSGGGGVVMAKLFKPQRVWALKRGLVGAVRDVAIGAEGSLIICTDSGHVYVRSRSSVDAALGKSGISASKGSLGGKPPSGKFVKVPYLQRVVGVCASSTGAFGALRVDAEVRNVKWPVFGSSDGMVDAKGWDLVRDLKGIRPWMWERKVESPLEREWMDDSALSVGERDDADVEATQGERKDGITRKASRKNSTSNGADKHEAEADEGDDDDGDEEIVKDVELLKDLCMAMGRLLAGADADAIPKSLSEAKLPYGADAVVSISLQLNSTPVASSGAPPSGKKARRKLLGLSSTNLADTSSSPLGSPEGLKFPVHSVLLGGRSKVLRRALTSSSDVILREPIQVSERGAREYGGRGRVAGEQDVQVRIVTYKDGSDLRKRIEFAGVHTLSVLILMHYFYTDELLSIWDRRVYSGLSSMDLFAKFDINLQLVITPALGIQVKSELQVLGRAFELPEMLKAMESVVKRPVEGTLKRDLASLFWEFNGEEHTASDHSATVRMLAPDVILELADSREVRAYSGILRARSTYFDDFLGEEEWTKERKKEDCDGLVRVDLKHIRWRVMEYVMKWMCYGQCEGLFGSLEFASSVDEVLEFLFEIIAVTSELILSPLMLLTSQVILKFLNIHNACYILAEASHYHAYQLVSSVQGYIAENLETFLERHMLDVLDVPLIKQLSLFIRQKQEEKAGIVRDGTLTEHAMEKWKEWLEEQDIPALVIPAQKKHRERKISHALRMSSPPSPSHMTSVSLGKQRENVLGSPSIRPRTSAPDSPVMIARGTSHGSAAAGDDIFDMDDVDIGPPSISTSERLTNAVNIPPSAPSHAPAWKASSAPRVNMRAVMAEAVAASDSQRTPVPTYVAPRGSPGDGPSLGSMRLRHQTSSQRKLSSVFNTPSTTPPSPSPRPGGSPWKIPAVQPQTQTSSSSGLPTAASVKPKVFPLPPPATPPRSQAPAPPSAGPAALGPVFTPSRQPVTKPSPSTPRRVSGGTNKAWVSAPVHEPLPPTVVSGMSFVAIQQLQLEQGVSSSKDKRSLVEIQQEEQERRQEEDFLKWWQAEEERVRLETEALTSTLADAGGSNVKKGRGGGSGQKGSPANGNKNVQKRQRKPKGVNKDVGTSQVQNSNETSGVSGPQAQGTPKPGGKKGPRGKKGPPASAS